MMIDPTLDEALTFVTRLAGEMKSEVDKDALVGDFWMSMREQLPEPLVYAMGDVRGREDCLCG